MTPHAVQVGQAGAQAFGSAVRAATETDDDFVNALSYGLGLLLRSFAAAIKPERRAESLAELIALSHMLGDANPERQADLARVAELLVPTLDARRAAVAEATRDQTEETPDGD